MDNNENKTTDFKQPDKGTMENIIGNYIQNEKALISQLYFTTSHGATIGGFREEIWKEMFQQIIPKKFVIEQSVFIIDSEGHVSNEVDLAIFDETYTPYIFHYKKLKFLPIEAVAVVVECKSTSLKNENLINWAKSIACLKTSNNSYARIIDRIAEGKDNTSNSRVTQISTRPLRILCCLSEPYSNKPIDSVGKPFDIILSAPSSEKGLKIEMDTEKEDLQAWFLALNRVGDLDIKEESKYGCNIKGIRLKDYEVKGKNDNPISLLTFNLQLNQILMLINNPILFPHIAYAEMFNKFASEVDIHEK